MPYEYYRDLSDEQWRAIEQTGWLAAKTTGRRISFCRRSILNGIRYQRHFQCSWNTVPRRYGHSELLFYYANTWKRSKLLAMIELLLQRLQLRQDSAEYLQLTDQIETLQQQYHLGKQHQRAHGAPFKAPQSPQDTRTRLTVISCSSSRKSKNVEATCDSTSLK